MTWEGYELQTGIYQDYEYGIVFPEKEAPGRPYIWRTEFFGAFPSVDKAMLKEGYAIVYYRISDMYGSPKAVKLMEAFQPFIQEKYGLSAQAVLFGFSRGGLYALHYGAKCPERIAALYLDAPVVDIYSWPGGCFSGEGAPAEWEDCRKLWNLSHESYLDTVYGAVDRLLAWSVPLIIVAGGKDETVPWQENGRLLQKAYERGGAAFQLIMKPECGHHPHSLENPSPVVDFLLKNRNYPTWGNALRINDQAKTGYPLTLIIHDRAHLELVTEAERIFGGRYPLGYVGTSPWPGSVTNQKTMPYTERQNAALYDFLREQMEIGQVLYGLSTDGEGQDRGESDENQRDRGKSGGEESNRDKNVGRGSGGGSGRDKSDWGENDRNEKNGNENGKGRSDGNESDIRAMIKDMKEKCLGAKQFWMCKKGEKISHFAEELLMEYGISRVEYVDNSSQADEPEELAAWLETLSAKLGRMPLAAEPELQRQMSPGTETEQQGQVSPGMEPEQQGQMSPGTETEQQAQAHPRVGFGSLEREWAEWTNLSVTLPAEEEDNRLLLVGDSISAGYGDMVQKRMPGWHVDRLNTSEGIHHPNFLRLLEIALGRYPYRIVHINNGIHLHGQSVEEYGRNLSEVFDGIRRMAPGAGIIFATTTPLSRSLSGEELESYNARHFSMGDRVPLTRGAGKGEYWVIDEKASAIYSELNEKAKSVCATQRIPVNDLYRLCTEENLQKSDGVHFQEDAYQRLADKVAEALNAYLG